MHSYARAEQFAQRIEQELRSLDMWRTEPLPASAFNSNQAFFADTMTFFQWLQFVLLVRIREVIAEKGQFPSQSQVGAYGVRELDGFTEAGDLILVLSEFDDFIEGVDQPPESDDPEEPAPVIEETAPVPAPREPPEPPLSIAERYWRTRDLHLLHSQPRARPSYDVQLAERVLDTATGLVELLGDLAEIPDGLTVTILTAERGSWLVLTALRLENGQWRIDMPLTLGHTAMMFLRQHHVHPPYTETNDARGRAMQFWQHIANRNERWARELLAEPEAEIPAFGDGQMDEFIWYLDHTEAEGTATVRVLINTHQGCRTLLTRLVQRDGAWFVLSY